MSTDIDEKVRLASVRIFENHRGPHVFTGSGTAYRASDARGNGHDYILTDAHVVTHAEQRHSVPGGIVMNGEYYHQILDNEGRRGIARLVTLHTKNICGLPDYRSPEETDGLGDQAILEIVDPVRDKPLFDAAWRKMAMDATPSVPGKAADGDPRPFHVVPFDLEKAIAAAKPPTGRFVAWGYPGPAGKLERTEGEYSALSDPEKPRQTMEVVLSAMPENHRLRAGYSGTSIVDRESGAPVGVLAAANTSMAIAVPIQPSLEKIRSIENDRRHGVYTGAGQSLPLCRVEDAFWHDSSVAADRDHRHDYETRLALSARQFREREAVLAEMKARGDVPVEKGSPSEIPQAPGARTYLSGR